MNIELVRFGNTEKGVFGELTVGSKTYNTVERPYINNEPYLSSVPAGEYRLVPHSSQKHGDTWALVNHELGVYHWPHDDAKRFAILIHVANKPSQVEGCIGVGARLGILNKSWAVLSSGPSIKKVLTTLATETTHTLTIRWAKGFEI